MNQLVEHNLSKVSIEMQLNFAYKLDSYKLEHHIKVKRIKQVVCDK